MNNSLDWYQHAKFGLFIHWGIYAAAGVEASWPIMSPDLTEAMFGSQKRITEQAYTTLAKTFNPVDFHADDWVRAAQEAGMGYIVMTAKHHDGFCMFDAPGTDYKITRTPFGRDVCLELAQACARANMPLGFYYSPPDMHHPGYRDIRKPAVQNWLGEPKRKEWPEYLDYMESHLRSLLTGYGEVKILWFDGLFNHGKYDPDRFHRLIRNLSPGTLINDRLGDDYDFITPEQFIPNDGIPVRTGKPPASIDPGGDGFVRTVEACFKIPGLRDLLRRQMQKYQAGSLELTPVLKEPYPSPQRFQPWETCMTMGTSWSWDPDEENWKDPQILLRNLVEVASRGGNYLLNVGPTERGTFPPQALERLETIGRWMKRYGDSLRGATYTPLQGQPWGRATRKGDQVYLHVFDWPSDRSLEIADFPGSAQAAHLFTGEVLPFVQTVHQVRIDLPAETPHPDCSVLILKIDPDDQAWTEFSPPRETKIPVAQYLKSQVMASALINMVINGLIAYFTYRFRDTIPYPESAVDILITVAIISFLVSWIAIGSIRQQLLLGNLSTTGVERTGWRFPRGSASRALLITTVCVLVYGGLILDGLLYLIAPAGFSAWGYILFKTLYTGASAALAALLSHLSVILEKKWR